MNIKISIKEKFRRLGLLKEEERDAFNYDDFLKYSFLPKSEGPSFFIRTDSGTTITETEEKDAKLE